MTKPNVEKGTVADFWDSLRGFAKGFTFVGSLGPLAARIT